MNTHLHLTTDEIIDTINCYENNHGRSSFKDIHIVDLDYLCKVEKRVIRHSRRLLKLYIHYLEICATAYEHVHAGESVDEVSMSYWIRLHAIAHAIINKDKTIKEEAFAERLQVEISEDAESVICEADIVADKEGSTINDRMSSMESNIEKILERLDDNGSKNESREIGIHKESSS